MKIKNNMLEGDKEFKRIALNIGTTLLVFFALFQILFYFLYAFLTKKIPTDTVNGEVVIKISYGFIYLAAFILPALFFRLISKKNTRIRPLDLFNPIKKEHLVYLFFTISIGFTCSYITSLIFTYTGVVAPPQEGSEKILFYQFLLSVFTTAIVPAVCEEFLFRATILDNLLPYGKNFAIIASALMFGLMHQNVKQMFYTTMAGIILGYAYAKTRSYLCVFLIHFCNNFIGVLQEFIAANLSEILAAIITLALETIIFGLGILSVILLAKKQRADSDVYSSGCYEAPVDPSRELLKRKLSFSPAKKFYLSPTVLIFTIISVLSVILSFVSLFA